jgi:P27 family predicted phage terminase small subunit
VRCGRGYGLRTALAAPRLPRWALAQWMAGTGTSVQGAFHRCRVAFVYRHSGQIVRRVPRFKIDSQKGQQLKKQNAVPQPPNYLRADTKRWFTSITEEFALDSHHVRLLTKACESWDRSELAREALTKHGLTYTDRFGSPKARPECAIDRDNKISFARLIREIGLDVSPPAETRPTTLRGNR